MIARAITAISEALRSSPACFAAVLLAGFFITIAFVSYQRDAVRRDEAIRMLLTRCVPTTEQDHGN